MVKTGENTIELLMEDIIVVNKRLNDGLAIPLASLIMMDKRPQEEIDEMYEEVKKQAWSLSALEGRVASSLNVKIDKLTLIFITFITEGNIGQSIVYAYYIQLIAKRKGIGEVNINTLCQEIFPWGFISDVSMHKFWNEQKSSIEGEDNMLDIARYSNSIM